MTATTFMRAAPSYWCSVYPHLRREIDRQRRRAGAISDPRLREIALGVLCSKRANLDGAAAFAAFVPAARRPAVIRAQVAFQVLYDYLDTLTEQPQARLLLSSNPVACSRLLHGALATAVDPSDSGPSCRSVHSEGVELLPRADADYTNETVQLCRQALETLPSYSVVQPSVSRLTKRIIDYQSFNISGSEAQQNALAGWARAETPAGSGLRWWETAASAGSSLGVFALIAMAASPGVCRADAIAVERAYFPWIGALHSLLDSLIDRTEDAQTGQQSLIEHYGCDRESARRLRLLASESCVCARALPQADQHMAILASMVCLYLCEGEASHTHAQPVRSEVLRALGPLATPAMLAMHARRLLHSWRLLGPHDRG